MHTIRTIQNILPNIISSMLNKLARFSILYTTLRIVWIGFWTYSQPYCFYD